MWIQKLLSACHGNPIASEQAINRLSGYPTTGIPSEQGINRELGSMTDEKVTRAHVNDTNLEYLVAVWTPPADCG